MDSLNSMKPWFFTLSKRILTTWPKGVPRATRSLSVVSEERFLKWRTLDNAADCSSICGYSHDKIGIMKHSSSTHKQMLIMLTI